MALLTESAARQYFPNEDPIGKTIKLGWGNGGPACAPAGRSSASSGTSRTPVSTKPTSPQIYLPFRQWPVSLMSVVIEDGDASGGDGRGGTPRGVRRRSQPAASRTCGTLDQIVATSISQPRFYMLLLAIFARCCAGARRNRHLRRPVVRGRPAHARDRHPHGARRAGRHRRAPRGAAGDDARGRGGRRRHGRRAVPVADDDEDAVQREADGPGDLRGVWPSC